MEKVGAYTDRSTPEGEWRPGNPATGQRATPMLSEWFNMLQRELLSILSAAGVEPDRDQETQLAQSMRSIAGQEAVFPGMILMFAGTVEQIPAGWKVCDGEGTTSSGIAVPDLRDRFILSAGNSYAAASTGGVSRAATSAPGGHTHTITCLLYTSPSPRDS